MRDRRSAWSPSRSRPIASPIGARRPAAADVRDADGERDVRDRGHVRAAVHAGGRPPAGRAAVVVARRPRHRSRSRSRRRPCCQPTTLSYTLAEKDSHLVPNTRFTARWRVTAADGTVTLGPRDVDPLRRHPVRLEDGRRSDRPGPLVPGLGRLRPPGARRSARRGSTTRRPCSGSPRPSRSTSSSTPTRTRSTTRSGRGPARTSAARPTPTSGRCSPCIAPDEIDATLGQHGRARTS